MEHFDGKKSSNLHWARYDPETRLLEIDFKNKAGMKVSTYEYENFPPEKWAEFLAASSQGEHFAYRIRNHYKATKMPAKEPDAGTKA
jgi:hypothetical protein